MRAWLAFLIMTVAACGGGEQTAQIQSPTTLPCFAPFGKFQRHVKLIQHDCPPPKFKVPISWDDEITIEETGVVRQCGAHTLDFKEEHKDNCNFVSTVEIYSSATGYQEGGFLQIVATCDEAFEGDRKICTATYQFTLN